MKDLVIDVGANLGGFALEVAERNPAMHVLAFEPIPSLCFQLRARAVERSINNLTVLQLAVDANERTAIFHIANHADQGVSSLLDFDAESVATDEYWRTRTDLYFEHEIDVSVTRLDSVLEIHAADRIRFIKIDAQGVDLAVLESLGTLLGQTEAGMLEVPATIKAKLYAQETHDLHTVITRLHDLGFCVYAIKPNDHASNEFNVFFCRRDLNPQDIEAALHLRGIQLYDGKHYWHAPSDRLRPDGDLAEIQHVLERLRTIEDALERECAETRRLGEAVMERDAQLEQLQLLVGQRT